MKPVLFQQRLALLKHRYQRLQMMMGVILLIMLLQTGLLWLKRERVIIHPPEITQAYWVQGHRFAPSYLEEMARYFCHLMLDVTPDSLPMQAQVLLRYAMPQSYGALKAQLVADATRLRQQQLSLHFTPKTTTVNVASLQVDVTGELHRYVGTRRLDSEQRTWRVTFRQSKGRLLLKAFESINPSSEVRQ